MSTVAEQLCQARQSRRLTIEQAAEITKIRGDYLRALEAGEFDGFPAPVYIRGFVRTYSTLLKLDVPQVMAALDSELSQNKKFSEPPRFSDHPRGVVDILMLQLSKIDWRKGVIVLAVVVLLGGGFIGYAFWRHSRNADPLQGLKPGVYQSKQGPTLPLPKR